MAQKPAKDSKLHGAAAASHEKAVEGKPASDKERLKKSDADKPGAKKLAKSSR